LTHSCFCFTAVLAWELLLLFLLLVVLVLVLPLLPPLPLLLLLLSGAEVTRSQELVGAANHKACHEFAA
jgi:hypothetical protein